MAENAEFQKFQRLVKEDEAGFVERRLPGLLAELGNILKEINDDAPRGLKLWVREAHARAAEDLSGTTWLQNGDRAEFVRNIIKGRPGDPSLRLAIYFLMHKVKGYESYAERLDKIALPAKRALKAARGWEPKKVIGKDELLARAKLLRDKKKRRKSFKSDYEANSQGSGSETEAAAQSEEEVGGKRPLRQPRLTPPRQTGRDYHFASSPLEVLGREEAQNILRDFRNAGPGFRWMQLAGAGGQGKSRLAYDLIEETGDDWEKNFITDEGLGAFKDRWEHWKPEKSFLIVVDYVIGAEANLKPAMQALAKRRESFNVAVCFLLVERQAWNDGGSQAFFHSAISNWYAKLTVARDGLDKELEDARFKDPRCSDGVVELTNLEPDQLLSIVRQLDGKRAIAASDDEIKDHLKRIDADGRPLYAYFLAQALIDGAFGSDWKMPELLTWVLQRDRERRWEDEFDGSPPDIGDDPPKLRGENDKNPAMRMALVASMIDSLSCDRFPKEEGWSRPDSEVRRQALILADAAVSGGTPAMKIPARQPDLLGDWFVLSSIHHGQPADWLAKTAWRLAPEKMAAFLERIARDFPVEAESTAIFDYAPREEAGKKAYAAIGSSVVVLLHKSSPRIPAGVVRALEWAVDSGDSRAISNLGVCYQQGIGVKKDAGKAVELFRQGVKAKDGWAMAFLGLSYQHGLGVEKDSMQAANSYCDAVLAGVEEVRVPLMVLSVLGALDGPLPLAESQVPLPDIGLADESTWADGPPVDGKWVDVMPDRPKAVARILARAAVLEGHPELFAGLRITAMREARLACYPKLVLVDLQLNQPGLQEHKLLSAFVSNNGAILLDGTAPRLYTLFSGREDHDAFTQCYDPRP